MASRGETGAMLPRNPRDRIPSGRGRVRTRTRKHVGLHPRPGLWPLDNAMRDRFLIQLLTFLVFTIVSALAGIGLLCQCGAWLFNDYRALISSATLTVVLLLSLVVGWLTVPSKN